MPTCPSCGEEYREGITECADCKVPLDPGAEGTEAQPYLVIAELNEADEAETLQAELEAAGFSCRVEEHELVEVEAGIFVFRVGVPKDAAEAALKWLETHSEEGKIEDYSLQVLRQWAHHGDPARRARAGQLLEELEPECTGCLEEISTALDGRNHDHLRSYLDHRIQEIRVEAAHALSRLGPGGWRVLGNKFLESIETGRWLSERARQIARGPAEEIESLVRSAYQSGDRRRKQHVLHVLPTLEKRGLWPLLVEGLTDSDPEVRNDAIESVVRIFEHDFGYDPDGDEFERREAVERIREAVGRPG